MRRAAPFFTFCLLVAALLLAVGTLWPGSTPPRVLAQVPAPAGLLTDTPTAVPSSPTDTPTPTPTVTPTACLVYFVDVPPDNAFYTSARCLSCRGIVGGYPCGGPGEPCPGAYFRPGNNVTRGQTSKIVTLAAQFTDPVPSAQQSFEDVPPSGTFWLYVERLSSRGIIGGYLCGGAGEPCVAPANRPYFRPNNNVTRGQLAKIVSGTAQYTETPIGQTFVDMPPSNPFYLYIERIAAHGTISGYPCGAPGEPCPGVYYRPNNNATRGQMAKIAANTFYPNCDTPGPTPTPGPAYTATPTYTATPPRTPAPTPTPCGTWSIVPSPNIPMRANSLRGVAVVSANDIWAVGITSNNNPLDWQTLVEHWDGTTWSIVPSPSGGVDSRILFQVTAVSATDIWAVGVGYSSGIGDQTLVEHWDGTNWSIIPSPNVGSRGNYLNDVTAISATDVWAVGSYGGYATSTTRALVEHWNGTSWSIVPTPADTVISNLSSVAAVGPDDIWVGGNYNNGGPTQALMEHWNGTSWSIVPAPNLVTSTSMAAVSSTDVWAVGGSTISHWDGTAWRVVPSPDLGNGTSGLEGVAAVGPSDVWAVGSYYPSFGNPYQAVTEHWDGTNWTMVPNPTNGGGHLLYDVAAVNANDVWAVGNGPDGTLTEHFTGTCP